MANPQDIDALLAHENPSLRQLMSQVRGVMANKPPGASLATVAAAPSLAPDGVTGDEPGSAALASDGAAPARDVAYLMAWLKKALQFAAELEFATVPPYLCALWSIRDEIHPFARSIREIVQEEMLHLSLSCNMLIAIGGKPRFTKKGFAPRYPSKLPGGVHPELKIGLSGLTHELLAIFMEIERPERPFDSSSEALDGPPDEDTTIGEFYEMIKAVLIEIQPTMVVDHQVTGPLSRGVIRNVDDAVRAIELIMRQGEGSSSSPTDSGTGDLAHYYRFLELHQGRQIRWLADENRRVDGDPIPQPEVWPMAAVPDGGYQQHEVSEAVWRLLDGFDETYTRLLELLDGTWGKDGQASFVRAIETMFKLQTFAIPLMQIPIPGRDGGTYGPCFRFKPGRHRA